MLNFMSMEYKDCVLSIHQLSFTKLKYIVIYLFKDPDFVLNSILLISIAIAT